MMDTVTHFAELTAIHLAAASIQVVILIVIVAAMETVARRASSAFRYWLWMIVLVRLCVPVGVSLPSGARQFIHQYVYDRVPSFRSGITTTSMSPTTTVQPINVPVSVTTPIITSAEPSRTVPPASVFGFFYLGTAALLGGVIVFRHNRLSRLIARSSGEAPRELSRQMNRIRLRFGITREVDLLVVDDIRFAIPAVMGISRPAIILPRTLAENSRADILESVFVHELVHIKRYDLIVNYLQIIIQVLYFFHPFVWFVNWRIRRLREDVCDDMSVQALDGARARYSGGILEAVAALNRGPFLQFTSICLCEPSSSIGKRIKRIMRQTHVENVRLPARSIAALVCIASAGLFVSCAINPFNTNSSESSSVMKGADYYPLMPGNNWLYHREPKNNSIQNSRTYTQYVDHTEKLSGNECSVVMARDTETGEFYGTSYFGYDAAGNVLYHAIGTDIGILMDFTPPYIVLPAELSKGSTWENTLEMHNEAMPDSVLYSTWSFRVERTDEKVSVPAGTFDNCLKISRINTDSDGNILSEDVIFYANNVGCIREIRVQPADQAFREDLVKFTSGESSTAGAHANGDTQGSGVTADYTAGSSGTLEKDGPASHRSADRVMELHVMKNSAKQTELESESASGSISAPLDDSLLFVFFKTTGYGIVLKDTPQDIMIFRQTVKRINEDDIYDTVRITYDESGLEGAVIGLKGIVEAMGFATEIVLPGLTGQAH